MRLKLHATRRLASYGFTTSLAGLSLDEAVVTTTAALTTEGFGIVGDALGAPVGRLEWPDARGKEVTK